MKKVSIFLILTFSLTWAAFFGLWVNGGLQNPSARVILAGCMLFPAISAVITTLVTKDKFKDVLIKPNFKKNIKYYLIAWFLPAILILIGTVFYYLIFPSNFDSSMSQMISALKEQSSSLKVAVPSDAALRQTLIIQLFIAIILSPIINFIPCLGEELGWRGYLFPNLCKKYSPLRAALITGFIWGLWHAPIIAMGYNYGLDYPTAPLAGIIAMILFCIFVGSALSYVTLKTKSCIPAVLSHGMINGFAASSMLFLAVKKPNVFLGPAPTGIIGGIGFILLGIICLILISKMKDFKAT